MKSIIMGFWRLAVALGILRSLFITKVPGTARGAGFVTPGRFLIYAPRTTLLPQLRRGFFPSRHGFAFNPRRFMMTSLIG